MYNFGRGSKVEEAANLKDKEEGCRNIYETHVTQWRIDLVYRKAVIIPEWEDQCVEMNAAWALQRNSVKVKSISSSAEEAFEVQKRRYFK